VNLGDQVPASERFAHGQGPFFDAGAVRPWPQLAEPNAGVRQAAGGLGECTSPRFAAGADQVGGEELSFDFRGETRKHASRAVKTAGVLSQDPGGVQEIAGTDQRIPG
jgi:hypothetical protein